MRLSSNASTYSRYTGLPHPITLCQGRLQFRATANVFYRLIRQFGIPMLRAARHAVLGRSIFIIVRNCSYSQMAWINA